MSHVVQCQLLRLLLIWSACGLLEYSFDCLLIAHCWVAVLCCSASLYKAMINGLYKLLLLLLVIADCQPKACSKHSFASNSICQPFFTMLRCAGSAACGAEALVAMIVKQTCQQPCNGRKLSSDKVPIIADPPYSQPARTYMQ
jgi:hypothetical protein